MLGVGSAVSTVGVIALALALILGRGALGAHADTPTDDGVGTPQFITTDSAPPGLRTTDTIPYWSSSFTDPTNGATYNYTMVGTNPYTTNVTTTIPVTIVPVSFTFTNFASNVNSTTLDGSTKVAGIEASPIFDGSADIGAAADSTASPAPGGGIAPSPRVENEPSDVTQVGDAWYRSQFGKSGSGYHVLLSVASVLPTVSISVPQNQGIETHGSVSHADLGRIDVGWFSSRFKELMGQLHADPHTFFLLATYNIVLYTGNNPANCCIIGYHGAFSPVGNGSGGVDGNGNQPIQTFAFASWTDPKIFRAPFIQDIHALSHEVSEWMDDPFVHNFLNPWAVASAPQYGCSNILEVGDPVVGLGFVVTLNGVDYHPEDETFFSWFARQNPSISSSASATTPAYTYLNNFKQVAQPCA
jgi:hypothetical protein